MTGVKKCLVSDINVDVVKPERGGVIIYTVWNGLIYFGFGLDSQTHEVTDLAGRIHYSKGENCIEGSIREFNEESLRIFDFDINSEAKSIMESPVIYDDKNIIIFLRTSLTPNQVSSAFDKAFRDLQERDEKYPSENCAMIWLSYTELREKIKTKKSFYSRTSTFLKKAGPLISIL